MREIKVMVSDELLKQISDEGMIGYISEFGGCYHITKVHNASIPNATCGIDYDEGDEE